MSASLALLGELEDAVTSGSPERRVAILRQVTDLFLSDADRFNEQQISVFDDVLTHLTRQIETRALAQLSGSLCEVGTAPLGTIRRLAGDDDIAVAGPVLRKSPRLNPEDLVELAQTKGQQHLLAISGRSSLDASVTDVLVARGDRNVVHSLAGNSGARFSQTGFTELVGRARSDESLSEKLGTRIDIPINLLRQIIERATEVVRQRLLAIAPAELQDRIREAIDHVAGEIGPANMRKRDFSHAEGEVEKLNRIGKLNEVAVFHFASDHQYEQLVAALALLGMTRIEVVETAMQNPQTEGLVIVCKAAGLGWETAKIILSARETEPPNAVELKLARNSFEALSREAAQRALRFFQVRTSTKRVS